MRTRAAPTRPGADVGLSAPARDLTKDKINVHQIAFEEDVWPPPLLRKVPVDRSIMKTESPWVSEHALEMRDLIQKIYDRANEMYGTNEKPNL